MYVTYEGARRVLHAAWVGGEAFGELAVVGQLRECEAGVRADHARPVRQQVPQPHAGHENPAGQRRSAR